MDGKTSVSEILGDPVWLKNQKKLSTILILLIILFKGPLTLRELRSKIREVNERIREKAGKPFAISPKYPTSCTSTGVSCDFQGLLWKYWCESFGWIKIEVIKDEKSKKEDVKISITKIGVRVILDLFQPLYPEDCSG